MVYSRNRLWDMFTLKTRVCAPVLTLQTCPCANFHIEGRVCMFPIDVPETMYNHTTLICKSFSVCNFWHKKLCLRTLVWLMRRTVRRLHCKNTCLYVNVLTYKDVSVCMFSHRRTCLYVTWHLIFHVVSRPPCVHTKVPPTRRIHAHFFDLRSHIYA